MYRTTADHDADRAAMLTLVEGVPVWTVCATCRGTGRVAGERHGREHMFLCGDCETEPHCEEDGW